MQEELDDPRAAAVQMPLQVVDRTVAIVPTLLQVPRGPGDAFRLQDLGVDPDDQHLLVVAAVEDADAAALGQVTGAAPEEIVLQFLWAWMLEAEHLATLRIDARHDVANDAVLTGRVHRLENQQHRMTGCGVNPLVQA